MAHVPVVSDKMKYGLKPIAVESKQHVLTLPCVGTNLYDGNTSSNIVFRIQHNPSGRFVDPTATRIKMTFTLSWPSILSNAVHTFFLNVDQNPLFADFKSGIFKDLSWKTLITTI